MKKLFTFLAFLALVTSIFAQQASEYFPATTGFKWNFKVTPLDSASKPVNSLVEFRVDSFATVADYKGQNANIVVSKTGLLETVQQQQFTDSSFNYASGSDGYVYLSSQNIEPFLTTLDDQKIIPDFSFVTFFASLQKWYSTFRFQSPENTEYLILQKDTSVSITWNNIPINLPVQFKYLGNRLSDQTLQTVLGNLTCKKFLISWTISSSLFGNLLNLNDTIWIAQDNWIVQDIMPGQYVDNLPIPGIPPFSIPGYEVKLTDQLTAVEKEKQIPLSANLGQNYPNPFNPTTEIVYSIPQRGYVSLKVYNLLGNEVADLVNGEMGAGTYKTNFDASSLPSGVYFYKLQTGKFVETKKMLLLK